MKTSVKQIPHPVFEKAVKLTPLQLNAMKCEERHTLLTPEVLSTLSETDPGK